MVHAYLEVAVLLDHQEVFPFVDDHVEAQIEELDHYYETGHQQVDHGSLYQEVLSYQVRHGDD